MTRLTTYSTCSGQGRDVGVVDDSARDLSLRLCSRRFPWHLQGRQPWKPRRSPHSAPPPFSSPLACERLLLHNSWTDSHATSDSSPTSSSSIGTCMILRSSCICPREQNEKHQ